MSNSNYGASWERELQERGFLDAGRVVQAHDEAALTFTFSRDGHVESIASVEWTVEIANPFIHLTSKGDGVREHRTCLIDDLVSMSWMAR